MSWKKIFDYTTPYDALDGIAERYVALALADLRQQIDADPDLNAAERESMLRLATPTIRAHTRAELEKGWIQCRLDMAGGTIH